MFHWIKNKKLKDTSRLLKNLLAKETKGFMLKIGLWIKDTDLREFLKCLKPSFMLEVKLINYPIKLNKSWLKDLELLLKDMVPNE